MCAAEAIPIRLAPLDQYTFTPFGEVVETKSSEHFTINDGYAERYQDVATLDVSEDGGRPRVSIFSAKPRTFPLRIHKLERHSLSSQLFVPLTATPFIVVVAPAGERPRPEDLFAFVTDGSQGVNFRRGTWHYPLIALVASNFLVIDRDGPGITTDERSTEVEILLEAPTSFRSGE